MTQNRSRFAGSAILLTLLCLASVPGAQAASTAGSAPISATASTISEDEFSEVAKMEKKGHFGEALARAKALAARAPNEARPRFLQGVILMDMNQVDAAIAVFEKLRQDFPEIPETYNNLAVLYMREGKMKEARDILETALQANPSFATAHENLGDIYAHMAGDEYARAAARKKLQAIRDILSTRPGN